MFAKRDDTRLRPRTSPTPSRRVVTDRRNPYSIDDEDEVGLTPSLRLKARDASPGSHGRISTSAPNGSTSPYLSRRYRDARAQPNHPDNSASGFTSGKGKTFQEPFQERGRMLSSYPDHANGETHGKAGRPRSFPEEQVSRHLSPNVGYSRYYGGSSPNTRDLSPGEYHRSSVGKMPSSLSGGDISPGSDEGSSTVTLTSASLMAKQITASGMEGSFTSDDGHTWHTALTCYLCGQLFRRPRILPCGHTFCSECLAQLKEETMREGRRVPASACTWEGRQKADIGSQFVCPMPECRYSMRLMNLGRWSTRNKTVSDAVTAYRKIFENRQDACTQTDITMESMLVTIPRSLLEEPLPVGSEGTMMRRSSSSLVDRMVHRALSMDSLNRNYIPQQHASWRSYVAMLGMHILQQVIHT